MEPTETLKEAVLWEPLEGRRVHCRLCSFQCRIADGKAGPLLRAEEHRRQALFAQLRQGRRGQPGPDREKAAVSFPAGQPELLHRRGRLQFSLRVLSKLADQPGGPGDRADRRRTALARADRGGRHPDRLQEHRLYVHRADHLHGVGRGVRPAGQGAGAGQRLRLERLHDPRGDRFRRRLAGRHQRGPQGLQRRLLSRTCVRPGSSRCWTASRISPSTRGSGWRSRRCCCRGRTIRRRN